MPSEKPEPIGFLALIDAKIAALQQLKDSLMLAISTGALGPDDINVGEFTVTGSTGGGITGFAAGGAVKGPVEMPTGVFRGQGLSDAIRLYLSMAKRKQTNQEIKNALFEGGLATTSEYFDQTLSSTLHRMRKTGELLQFKDGWDLAASYPDSFRQRMTDANDSTPKGPVGRRRKHRRKKGEEPGASAKKASPEIGHTTKSEAA